LIAQLCTPPLKGFHVGVAAISQFLVNLQVLSVYAGFLAAILKNVVISMSLFSADCTIVFSTHENIGFAVGIASISQLLAKLQVIAVYSI